jgi:hypothetical protein
MDRPMHKAHIVLTKKEKSNLECGSFPWRGHWADQPFVVAPMALQGL